jgi:VRR-NUC domain
MSLSEADFQRRVIDTAKLAGWMVAHFRPALTRSGRWATPMQGDKGLPDLVLAKDGRLLLAELKTDTGQVSKEQRAWLAELGAHGRLWRPKNWEAVLLDLGVTKRPPLTEEDIWERAADAAEGEDR